MQTSSGTKERNHCLDVLKGIACIGVVFIHVGFPGIFGELAARVAGFAVPLFFLTAGYYAWRQNQNQLRKTLPKKIKYIAIIIAAVFPLYFLKNLIIVQLQGESAVQWLTANCSMESIWNMLLRNDFSGLFSGILWFLPALLYCYAVLYLMSLYRIRTGIRILIVTVPLLFLFRILITGVSDFTWHRNSNFLLCGIPYFMTGFWFAERREKKSKEQRSGHRSLLLAVSAAGILFFCAGIWISTAFKFFEAGIIAASVSLFFYAIENPAQGKDSVLETIGRDYSLFVYVMHIMTANILELAASILNVAESGWYVWSKPLAVLLLTLLSGVLFHKIRKRVLFHKNAPRGKNDA